MDSPTQTGHVGQVDWQEETYQKIKSMKEQYLTPLVTLYRKVDLKLQQINPQKVAPELLGQYGKLKICGARLGFIINFLQISKENIQPAMEETLPLYEEQISGFLAPRRSRNTIQSQPQGQQQFRHPGGHAHSVPQPQSSQVSQMHQHDNSSNPVPQMIMQSSATLMQPNTTPRMRHVSAPSSTQRSVSTAQRNSTNGLQLSSYRNSIQSNTFSSLQQGAIGSVQGGVGSIQYVNSAPQQINNSALLQSSGNTLQPNRSHMQPNSSVLKSQPLKQQNHEEQQQLLQLHVRRPIQQQPKQNFVQPQQPLLQQLRQTQQQPLMHQMQNHKHLKTGVSSVIPCQICKARTPQISHHISPQTEPSLPRGSTPSQPVNSPFLAPSPSTPLVPSPIPGDSEKHLSGISSPSSADNVGHQRTTHAPAEPQQLAVGTPRIPTSPLLEEFTSPDGNRANVQTKSESREEERPLHRLIKVIQRMTPEALQSAANDMCTVAGMNDMLACSAPGKGSRAAIGQDLSARCKYSLQARIDERGEARKVKRHSDAMCMPMNQPVLPVSSADLESSGSPCVKRHKTEVNSCLLEEIREINHRLINTIITIDNAASWGGSGGGTVIECCFNYLLSSSLETRLVGFETEASLPPLRMLVPSNYPESPPILLPEIDEPSREYDDKYSKARSRLSKSLSGLSYPMSLGDMVRAWDDCLRGVLDEYAQQFGGGTFSSRYGVWQSCMEA